MPGCSEIRQRSQLTPALRDQFAAFYTHNEVSALKTAKHFGIGKSTVLKILKSSGTDVRPRGRRLT
jgi:DNA invertase Pin-like site-specific DNA recombinase